MTEQSISPEFIRWLFSAQIEAFKLTRAHNLFKFKVPTLKLIWTKRDSSENN